MGDSVGKGPEHGGRVAGGGVLGKLESGASGCRMSYKNSGMIGTVNEKKIQK